MDIITIVVGSMLILMIARGINAKAESRAAGERALLTRLAECTKCNTLN